MASTKGTYQPLAQAPMDVLVAEKAPAPTPACRCGGVHEQSLEDAQQCAHVHAQCHKRRRRRLFHFAAAGLAFLALLVLLAHACGGAGAEMVLGLAADAGSEGGGVTGIFRRQSNSSSGSGQSVFVKNKLYLIVVLVGLVVCLILGIMLAGWCCRGVFENPCCCPCYVCACCGGLALLDCISCALCAEGVSDIGFN